MNAMRDLLSLGGPEPARDETIRVADLDPMAAAMRIRSERGLEASHQVDPNRGWHCCQRTGAVIGPSATIRPREGRGVRITVISDRTGGAH